jgi:hypothetical protein
MVLLMERRGGKYLFGSFGKFSNFFFFMDYFLAMSRPR